MRSVSIWMGLVATALMAGCASEPAQNSPPPAPEPVAATAGEAASAKPAAEQAALDENEIICRNEKPLGTRIGKRVCKTRAQIAAEEKSAKEMMKNRDSKSHNALDGTTGGG